MLSFESVTKFIRTLAIVASGVLAISLTSSTCQAQVKVACVGDSITAGYGLSNPGADSYPAQLQVLLGSGYQVGNFGLSGSTALKKSDYTYWNSWAYRESTTNFKPDIVVIMLGTNDSKSWNWNATNFNTDCKALIAEYQALSTHPKVYICLIAPAFLPNAFGKTFDPAFIQNTVVPAVRRIGTEAGVPVIDNNTCFIGHPELFQDGIHPTRQGGGMIAKNVKAVIAP